MSNDELVKKAEYLSKEIYRDNIRKSGDTYLEHSRRVVKLLLQVGIQDKNTLAAAYLHHILDFSPKPDIEELFNKEIYDIVSDYKILSEDNFSNINAENVDESLVIQTYLNLAKNPKTLLIRLADKTDNITSAHNLPKENSQNIARRALYIYSPICKILGIHKFVRILEDGAMKILNPRDYFKIQSYIDKNYPRVNMQLEEIKEFLSGILEENGIHAQIEYRTKGIYSTYAKAKKYFEKGAIKRTDDLRNIFDFAGLRILVSTIPECYKTEEIICNMWDVIPETRNDYISNPKPNGYMSLQSSYSVSKNLILEIQIRTFEMHEENEYGQASHAVYKIGSTVKKDLSNNPNLLREISYSLNKENINITQFSKYVYVYTPKGDIKRLPIGSNLLDFAYSIHKDLGNSAIGGNVNGIYKPLDHILENGNVVEIKTSKNKDIPSIKFLDLVKTRKARDEIRKANK